MSLIVNTHCHADHITSTGLMKKRMVGLKSAISKFSGASADIHLLEGDKITFGKHVRETFYSFRSFRLIHETIFVNYVMFMLNETVLQFIEYIIYLFLNSVKLCFVSAAASDCERDPRTH